MIKKGRASLADIETELSALRTRLPLSGAVQQHPVMSVWQPSQANGVGGSEGGSKGVRSSSSTTTATSSAPKTKYFDGVVWGSDVVLDRPSVARKTTSHEDEDIVRYLGRAKREFAKACEESIGQFEYDEAYEQRKNAEGSVRMCTMPDGSQVLQSTVLVKTMPSSNNMMLTTAPTVAALTRPGSDVVTVQARPVVGDCQNATGGKAAPAPPKVAKTAYSPASAGAPRGLYDLPVDLFSQTKTFAQSKTEASPSPQHARRGKANGPDGDGAARPGGQSGSLLLVESTTAALIPASGGTSKVASSDARTGQHFSPAPSSSGAASKRKEVLATSGTVVAHSSVDLSTFVTPHGSSSGPTRLTGHHPSPPRPQQPILTTLVVSHVNSGRVRFCPECSHVVLGDGGGFCPHCRAQIVVTLVDDDEADMMVNDDQSQGGAKPPDSDAARQVAQKEVSRIEAEERAAFQAAIAEWRAAPKDEKASVRPVSASVGVGNLAVQTLSRSGHNDQYIPCITHTTYFSFLWRLLCVQDKPTHEIRHPLAAPPTR